MRWILLVTLLAGCPPAQEGNLLLDERFENEATFRQYWQIFGSVSFDATIHPAEHALFAHGQVTLDGPFEYSISDPSEDGEWIEYSTPCTGEPELWWQGGASSYQLYVSIPSGAQVGWRRVHANLPPDEALPFVVDGITLELDDPAGTCPIDNLRIYQPAYAW